MTDLAQSLPGKLGSDRKRRSSVTTKLIMNIVDSVVKKGGHQHRIGRFEAEL